MSDSLVGQMSGTAGTNSTPEEAVESKVFAIELHAGVNFGGFVAGNLTSENAHNLSLSEEINGIRVKGPKCNKLIPWAALKGVDYFNDDGSKPLTSKGKI
jgi:hypothetical protein